MPLNLRVRLFRKTSHCNVLAEDYEVKKLLLRSGVLQWLREFEVKISSSSDSQSTITGVGISEATYYFYRRFVGMGNRQLSELRSL